jgi:hypothetical protein
MSKKQTQETLNPLDVISMDRNPDLEHALSNILYSTIACTLVEPDAINFNVEAAVNVIVQMFEPLPKQPGER